MRRRKACGEELRGVDYLEQNACVVGSVRVGAARSACSPRSAPAGAAARYSRDGTAPVRQAMLCCVVWQRSHAVRAANVR